VAVDEVAGHPVLAGQYADGSHVVRERALELLDGSRFERLHERRIVERSIGTLAGFSTSSSLSQATVVVVSATASAAVRRRRSPSDARGS
jgi:hypothetical protein